MFGRKPLFHDSIGTLKKVKGPEDFTKEVSDDILGLATHMLVQGFMKENGLDHLTALD